MYKKVDPFKFKLAITYCINLTAQIDECARSSTRGKLTDPFVIGPAGLKNILT